MSLFLQLVEIECGAEKAPSIFSGENEVDIGRRGGGIGEVPSQGLAKLEGGREEEKGEEEARKWRTCFSHYQELMSGKATCTYYTRVILKLQFQSLVATSSCMSQNISYQFNSRREHSFFSVCSWEPLQHHPLGLHCDWAIGILHHCRYKGTG